MKIESRGARLIRNPDWPLICLKVLRDGLYLMRWIHYELDQRILQNQFFDKILNLSLGVGKKNNFFLPNGYLVISSPIKLQNKHFTFLDFFLEKKLP